MRLRRSLAVAAALLGEIVAFSLALLVVVRWLDDTALSWWSIIVTVGAVYLVVGAAPVPRVRHPALVGIPAFVVPLVVLGWIGWRTDLGRLVEHVRAWEGLPQVILAPANLGTALFLSACAVVGCGLARRIRGRASRGIGPAALGLEAGVVRVVEYDARWPDLFRAERERIRAHCIRLPIRLEHVGGTAIPGMYAKPIVDIAAGRPRGADLGAYVAALGQAGYEHRGERGVAGRELFCRGEPRAYHLHLVEEDGPHWRGYLAFRDYLRSHPGDAHELAAAKRALAERFPHDREAYVAAKAPQVEEILRRAGAG